MTLTVNPNIEILVLKQMLLHKISMMDTVAATTGGTTQLPTATMMSLPSSDTTSILTTLLGFFWWSSLFTPKVQAHDLSFMYRGKPLEDDMPFCAYYNTGGANTFSTVPPTIHVSVRLQGGCFMVSATVLGMIMTAIIGSTCTCGLSLIAVPFLLPLLFILPFFCL
jgi:hypothetical protein